MDEEVKESLRAEKTSWIKRGCTYLYAERNKYDESKSMVKTYANKKQANKKINELRADGFDAYMGLKHPFTILCAFSNVL